MPFLDGFAQAFTGMYNATSSRRSERERTSAAKDQTAAQSRHWLAEEEVARGALDVDKGRLAVEQGDLAVRQSAETRAQEDAPGIRKARAAETALNQANAGLVGEQAAAAKWANSDAGRDAVARKLASDIDYQSAQSEAERAAARANVAKAALDEWALTEEGKEATRLAREAAIRLSDAQAAEATGAAASSAATARSTDVDTSIKQSGPGLRATINAQQLLQKYFPGVSLEEAAKYGQTSELPTRAIPEGEPAPEPELTTRPYSDAEPVAAVGGAPPAAPSPAPDQARVVPGQEIAAGAPPVPIGATPPALAGAERGAIPGPTSGPTVQPTEAPVTTPEGPLSNTYPTGAETAPPPRAGEPRLPAPEQPKDFNDLRDETVEGVEQIAYKPGSGKVIEAQSGTRRLPLSDRTRGMLEQASAATGYDVRVTSGAQPSSGPNRVGSHRHDVNVGSGDVQLIDRETGKPVSMATTEGQQAIIKFMRAARDAGATGFGAGPDYMGNTTIHVGFGSPSVWGAGGKAANAPKWLVQGMSGGGDRPSAVPDGTGVKAGIQGEKVASEAIETARMPTPRGEVKTKVNRTILVQNAVVAAKEAANYGIQKAGLAGPAPAITDAGRTASQRAYLSGAGAASPTELANAQQAIQESIPGEVDLTELNLLTLASAYDWYTTVEPDPDKAKAVAFEISQAYRKKVDQYASIAKVTAQGGDLDKAAQVMAKAYAYIPNGEEVKFTKDKQGNFLMETTDVATGRSKMKQVVPPDQLFAGIMGWSSVDFDKHILRAAGETVSSNAFEAHSAQAAQAIPEAPPGTPPGTTGMSQDMMMRGAPPVGGEPPVIPDVAQMDKDERSAALDVAKMATANRDEARKLAFGKPFSPEERDAIDVEIAAVAENMPDKMAAITELFPNAPEKVGRIILEIQQMNPNVDTQSIVSDLADIAAGDANNPNFSYVGETAETTSIQAPDSGVLNMPTNTFATLWNALVRKTPDGVPVSPTAARDADTEAEKRAAAAAPVVPQAIPTGRTGQPMISQGGRGRTGQPMYSPVPLQPAIPTRANPMLQPQQRRVGGTGRRGG